MDHSKDGFRYLLGCSWATLGLSWAALGRLWGCFGCLWRCFLVRLPLSISLSLSPRASPPGLREPLPRRQGSSLLVHSGGAGSTSRPRVKDEENWKTGSSWGGFQSSRGRCWEHFRLILEMCFFPCSACCGRQHLALFWSFLGRSGLHRSRSRKMAGIVSTR